MNKKLDEMRMCNIVLQNRFGQSTAKPSYNIRNLLGLKFLTRLRLGLSHLNENNFKYCLQDGVNPSCSFSLKIESLSLLFLHCHLFTYVQPSQTLFSQLTKTFQVFPIMKKCIYFFMEALGLTAIKVIRSQVLLLLYS